MHIARLRCRFLNVAAAVLMTPTRVGFAAITAFWSLLVIVCTMCEAPLEHAVDLKTSFVLCFVVICGQPK
jgi:hypothetical protein